MTNIFQKFKQLVKADAIRNPRGLAEYVSRRYGTKSPEEYERGIVGKINSKVWNKVSRSSDKKTRSNVNESGQLPKGKLPGKGKKATRDRAGYGTRGIKRRFKGFGGPELKKAQDIKDARRLAGHLTGEDAKHPEGGKKTLWHGSDAGSIVGDRPWKDYEGGIRGKENSEEWNPIVNRDQYDETGMRLRTSASGKQQTYDEEKQEKEEKSKREKRQAAGKAGAKKFKERFEAGVAGKQRKLPGFSDSELDTPKKESRGVEKAMDILKGGAVPKKFGGKPLKWEDLPRDPVAFATNVLNHKGFWYSNLGAKSKGSNMRNQLARDIRDLIRDIPEATKKEQKQGKLDDQKDTKEYKEVSSRMKNSWKNGDTDMKKQVISPSLLRILGFGAGWAMSDTFTEAPRGQMTPSQQRDWERLIRTSMRRKKNLSKEDIDSLQTHYNDLSDTYVKRVPIDNGLNIIKDHAPIPPRQGLVWDEQKKHWTRPEHVGHSVSEVQGKKRIRGTGTGVHEHSIAVGQVGGKGAGSAVGGRRFRGAADVGVAKPHESIHPSTSHLARTKPAKKAVQNFLAAKKKRAAS